MILTTLTNKTSDHSQALANEAGTVLKGVTITFALCTAKGIVVDAWDVLSKQRVCPSYVDVTTDEFGEFSVDLWPTSRGISSFYRCSIPIGMVRNIIAPLDESVTPVLWYDWMAAGAVLEPTGQSIFTAHTSNLTVHLSTQERAFLSHCSVSPAGLPLWDGAAWPGSGTAVLVPTVSDASDGKAYQIVSRYGELYTVETASSASLPAPIIAIDILTGTAYSVYTINGSLVTEELASGVASHDTLTDSITGVQYKIAVSNGELITEEI